MAPKLPDDAEILRALRGGPARPLHATELASLLDVPFSLRHELHEALDALVQRGLLAAMPGQRYRLPRQRGARVEGRFGQNARGFGFVTASDGGDDVFVPPTGVQGAMHGDLVAVEAVEGAKGREGVVLEVLTRRSAMVPGVLRIKPHGAWVEPDDPRVRGPIPVDNGEPSDDGTAVLCEVTVWPTHAGEAPKGRVRQSLGTPGALDVEVRKVILREGVEETFSEAVEAEAAGFPPEVLPAEWEGREDLRAVPFVTIDPEDARDHDDAVCVEPLEGGGWLVRVAIADVSHYVRPGTEIDRAALARGTSIYLPDRAIPMLPRALSSHLASLLDGVDRLALGVDVTLADTGHVRAVRLWEGVIRCAAGLTYGQVAATLGWTHEAEAPKITDAVRAHLAEMARCTAKLRQKRLRQGALDLDLPEGRVRFADDLITPVDVYQSRKDPGVKRAYQVVEELMLLANEEVGRACVEADAPAVFRVHGAPDEELLSRFWAVAQAWGHKVDVEFGKSPKRVAAFLKRIQGKPEARVLSMLLLRAMPQAKYSAANTGHFGLALNVYLHFTSPIRRYPDLAVHRVVRALVRKQPAPRDEAARNAVSRAAAESSRMERRAMDVEREVLDLYRCVVAKGHVGELHTATVTGVTSAGPFLDLESPFVTGLLRVEGIEPGQWEVDELGVRIRVPGSGLSYSLGEQVLVEITDVAVLRRTIYLGLPAEARAALKARKLPKAGASRGAKPTKSTDRGRKERRR